MRVDMRSYSSTALAQNGCKIMALLASYMLAFTQEYKIMCVD